MAKHKQYRTRANKDIKRIRQADGDGNLAREHANAGLRLHSRDFAQAAIRLQRDSAEFYQELKVELQTTFEAIQAKVDAGESTEDIQTYFTGEVKRIQENYLAYVDEPLRETVNDAFRRIGPLFRQHVQDRKDVLWYDGQNQALEATVNKYKGIAAELEAQVAELSGRTSDIAGAIAEALRNYTPPAIPKADQATLDELKNL
jgi:hypothetical protein